MAFTHLHVHTEYSLLDGMIRTKDLIARCVQLGMNSAAITDHGNVFAAIEFLVNTAKHNKGVKAWNAEHPGEKRAYFKPILGCEVYLSPTSMRTKKQMPGRSKYTHLVLLCENNQGWSNLIKLVSISHLDGFYYKPRVDMEVLRQYSNGLICLTGCISGPMQEWILQGKPEKAEEVMLTLRDIFGENNLFVELQDHELPDERTCTPELVRLARKHGVPLVVTNDSHFLNAEDFDAHDILICVGTGNKRMDGKRMHYPASVYLKSEEEMRRLFPEYPEAYENTQRIAERCNVSIKLDSTSTERYPEFATPDGSPREEYLRKVCFEGLIKRYGEERVKNDPVLTERLETELGVINQLRFASYFLITADFINWAKDHDIPVGPGRGSAAGSLVAYCLRITNIDPLAFDLLFERFLNPERVSPPDIDIDFCQTRRPEVIDYVREKYGERAVSHIITYGTMGAKSAIRDVARVLDMSFTDSDHIAKLIDVGPNVTLQSSYDSSADLRDLVRDGAYAEVWKYAKKLEGTIRNVGMHAAGVVIGDRPLDEYVALTRDDLGNPQGEVVTQCDMSAIYNAGLLKMDFLGLKTLTVMKDAEHYVRQRVPNFRYDEVPIDDAEALALLNRGDTLGIFQLESGGMVDTCRKYGIDRIDDIIALLALYRPGAMEFIDEMIAVKKGEKAAVYEHPLLERVSGPTYGVMIYQEQVQAAAKLLAGYTLGGADILRRAMGHKDMQEMKEQRARFVKGCRDTNDIDEKTANAIFDKIQTFAGYGFNKSHSACYGHISYWTAYLKAHFPVEFMCGLMSNEVINDKIGIFIQEANRMGIEVLGPCVNYSDVKFRPETMPNGHLAVRFGLASVKNMSAESVRAIVEEREARGPFKSLEDFCYRISPQNVRRNQLEVLVQCGAFDCTHTNRATLFNGIERAINGSASVHHDNETGQMTLFGLPTPTQEDAPPSHIPEWSKQKRLDDEKSLTGAYFTGNPLDSMRGVIDLPKYVPIGSLQTLSQSAIRNLCDLAGMIRSVSVKTSKNNAQRFAVITLEDFTGSTEILVWGDAYSKAVAVEGLLQEGNFVRVRARVSVDERNQSGNSGSAKRVAANSLELITPGTQSQRGKSGNFYAISLLTTRHDAGDLAFIKKTLADHPGNIPVRVSFRNSLGNTATIELGNHFAVTPSPELDRALARYA